MGDHQLLSERGIQDDRYVVSELLGEGSYGVVFKGKRKDGTGQVCALKYIKTSNKDEVNDFLHETNIMEKLNHPNIILFLEKYEIPNYRVLAMECAPGELYHELGIVGSFPENRVRQIACQLFSAVFHLHSKSILHRDLKPENVLLMDDGTVKLCDFGFAREYFTEIGSLPTTIKSTPMYMAPEIAGNSIVYYSEKVDIWSLGAMVYELFLGKPPFEPDESNDGQEQVRTLVEHIVHCDVVWPDNIPAEPTELLQHMLKKEPKQRCSWPTILDHSWLRGVIQVSPEDRARESAFTRPGIQEQTEGSKNMVYILSDGGEDVPDAVGSTDATDGADDMDVIVLISPLQRRAQRAARTKPLCP
ncbi:serine/threonine-protein kinase 36-like [Haliotis rufescens]|uniref:serine/threonine-protein kinase 36-like n=1 Tax=Haliotis rufescens TaxID=6454 RepID=UPI00201EB0CD|nr:serine/threonine-protein kinase 36-like [Haliotis rufescens]